MSMYVKSVHGTILDWLKRIVSMDGRPVDQKLDFADRSKMAGAVVGLPFEDAG